MRRLSFIDQGLLLRVGISSGEKILRRGAFEYVYSCMLYVSFSFFFFFFFKLTSFILILFLDSALKELGLWKDTLFRTPNCEELCI